MQIVEVLEQVKVLSYIGRKDQIITDITYDSRNSGEFTAFCAIKGFKVDGHHFIQSAIDHGCPLIVCEKLPETLIENVNYIQVENSRKALSEISAVLTPEIGLIPIMGVTGTNGKTSISYLLKYIYDFADYKTGVIGTMGALIGDEKIDLENTTPEAPDLHHLLKTMVEKKVDYCFMEVSSHGTELYRTESLRFKTGIFTNLTEDHLILHKTMENYYQAKKKFFYQVDKAIVNLDDAYGERLYQELKQDGVTVFGYSSKKPTDGFIQDIIISKSGSQFKLTINNNTYSIAIKTPGEFNIYNYTSALMAAIYDGINPQKAIHALEKIPGVVGRFEFLESTLDCAVILDFAHTPDGLQKVLETINQFAKGRKLVLFGAQGERDISRRGQMGDIAGHYCDYVVLTSDNPVYEDPYDICMEIAEAVKKHHQNIAIILDREQAIRHLIMEYEPGDTILLAGKSTEPYQIIKDKKVPYDEKTVALRAIRHQEIIERSQL